jgi:hypothetical protein
VAWPLVLGAALVGCGSDEAGGTDIRPVFEAAVDRTIVPAFSAFTTAANTLQERVDGFCRAPARPTLQAAQDQWRETARQWNEVAAYNIGPLNDDIILPSILFVESMRQRGTDFTQTVRDSVDRAVGGDEPLDAAFFDSLRPNQVGLLALEVLLFEDSARTTAAADVVAGFQAEARRCSYLAGLSGLLADRARSVEQGWTTEFGDSGRSYRDLLLDGDIADELREPVEVLFVAVVLHLEYLRVRKLQAIPDARLAGTFFENLGAALDAVDELMGGVDPGQATFFDLMDENGFPQTVARVEEHLANARAAVEASDQEGSATAFGELEASFRQLVPSALGINLGLIFTDGD